MNLKDKIFFAFLGIVGQLLIRSLRIEVIGMDNYRALRTNGTPVIFVMWHSRLLMFFRHSARLRVATLVSPGRDGEIGARIAGRLGINMVRGNSDNSPVASVKILRNILIQGGDIGLFADGPLGPAQKLKPGILFLARSVNNSQILPAGADANWKITFRGSWDNFVLPLPFSRVVLTCGEPIGIPADTHKQEFHEIIDSIERQINELQERSTASLASRCNRGRRGS